MPRRAAPSPHPLAAVRTWFGLGQAELALYLGVSQTLVHAVESGRCALGPDGQVALLPLLRQLPPPEARARAETPAAAETAATVAPAAAALPALPPGTPAPDPDDLDLRRADCLAQATRLRQQAARLAQQARVAARWATALPALLPPDPDGHGPDGHGPDGHGPDASTAAPPPVSAELAAALARRTAPLPHDPVPDPQRPAQHARWLRGWLRARAPRRRHPLRPPAGPRRRSARRSGSAALDEECALKYNRIFSY